MSLFRCLLLLLTALAPLPLAAQAMRIDPAGRGDVLIFPYFTANGGQQTLLSLSNSGERSKAYKLRIRRADDARVLLSMNVYLGGYDTWTAAIFAPTPTSAAVLTTQDDSCTVPSLRADALQPAARLADGRRYLPFALDSQGRPDGTREGYIEIITMVSVGKGNRVDLAVRRGSNGRKCQDLEEGWRPDGWLIREPDLGVVGAVGELYGRAYIVAPDTGTAVAIRPTAIDQFSPYYGVQTAPEAVKPNLYTSFNSRGGYSGEFRTQAPTEFGEPRSLWTTRADAVNAVLLRTGLAGEINRDPAIGAETEWVLTDPMLACRNNPDCTGRVAGTCPKHTVRLEDREGQVDDGFGQPPAPDPFEVTRCDAVEVWAWGQTGTGPSAILKSERARRVPLPPTLVTGQARIRNTLLELNTANHQRYEGAPMIGHTFGGLRNAGVGTGLSGFFVENAPLVGWLTCTQLYIDAYAPCQ